MLKGVNPNIPNIPFPCSRDVVLEECFDGSVHCLPALLHVLGVLVWVSFRRSLIGFGLGPAIRTGSWGRQMISEGAGPRRTPITRSLV